MSGDMRESKSFFFGGTDTQTPLGVYIGKSRALHWKSTYKTQNANASVNIYMPYP